MNQSNDRIDLKELEGGHVFRMLSVQDIFAKLYREKRRFEQAGSDNEGRKEQVDAAINFAITAWHMIDWVWHRQEHELRKRFGVKCFNEFQSEMRRQCPDLAVCDVIANAAKHGGVARPREDRPELVTVLVAEAIAQGQPGVELNAVVVDRDWSLKLSVNGKAEDPHAVFHRVFGFWHKFIQHH
jgi:hypothetical protein